MLENQGCTHSAGRSAGYIRAAAVGFNPPASERWRGARALIHDGNMTIVRIPPTPVLGFAPTVQRRPNCNDVWISDLQRRLDRRRAGTGQITIMKPRVTSTLRKRPANDWDAGLNSYVAAALAHISEAVITTDAFDRINFMNTAAERLTGLRLEEVAGSRLSSAVSLVHSISGERIELTARPEEGLEWEPESFRHAVLLTKSSGGLTIEYSVSAIHDERGVFVGTVVAFRDIARRRAAELALQASEETLLANSDALFAERERAQVTLNAIGDAVVSADFSGRVIFTNVVAEQMSGWKQNDASGRAIDDVFVLMEASTGSRIPCPTMRAIIENRIVAIEAQTILRRRDGSAIAIEGSASPIHDKNGGVVGAVMVVHDVTAARDLSAKLERLALHDSLTDLPNRSLFTDRLDRALARASRAGNSVVLLFIDLDEFKPVNDTLGHALGDRLLQSVADRLRRCMRQADTVSRFGGDEFLVLLPDVAPTQDAAFFAAKAFRSLQAVHHIGDHELQVTASIGVSSYPRDAADGNGLLKCADTAMYKAKTRGGNRFEIFEPMGDPLDS
jgi:diguanylate cyclase (GGDEF)-like protein/PAS domain S-box-containing protein